MIEKLPNMCCCSRLILPLAFDESWSYLEKICALQSKMNELISLFNDDLEKEIKAYIDKRFNDIMMDTLYDEPTETLILFLKKDEAK